MGRKPYLLLLALILALGAYLRFVDLGGPSLWHDEIIHLEAAQTVAELPWYRNLTGVREVSGWTENGPIYYGMLLAGQRLAPGEVGARLLPATIGTLTLVLMAMTGRLLGGSLVSVAATFLLAVSPLHVYFSREGRPYSLIMFLALGLLYVLLEKGTKRGIVLAYGGCLLAAYVGVHSVPILMAFLALSGVAFLWTGVRNRSLLRSPFLHYVVAAVMALALTYGLYLTRSTTNKVDFSESESPVYKSPLSERAMERFLASMTTSGHQSVLPVGRSWVLIGLSLVGVVAGLWRRPGETLATVGMFVLPAALSIAALVSVGRWYGLRYTTSALPAFLLLVALGVAGIARLAGRVKANEGPSKMRDAIAWTTAGVLLLLFAAPNVEAARADPYRKLDWRGVADFFREVAIDGEPIVTPNTWSEICLGYYLRDSGMDLPFVNIHESVTRGREFVENTPKGWLLTAGFRRTGDARAWMHQFQPVLKKREEEMALFFFPDFVTLLETRFAAGKGAFFEEQFEAIGHRFDFGGAESTLQGGGWSYHEENKAGVGYQWALGEQAELGLPVGQASDASLRFRALPFTYPEAPGQIVELWLNESLLATLDLPSGWSEHEVAVPATTWSTGANVLFLRFGRTTIPSQMVQGSKDRRSLSAAFDYLEVVTH